MTLELQYSINSSIVTTTILQLEIQYCNKPISNRLSLPKNSRNVAIHSTKHGFYGYSGLLMYSNQPKKLNCLKNVF